MELKLLSIGKGEGPTKTQGGGLTIKLRTTPQAMFSTDGGKSDPVRLFEFWLSKWPEGMKNTGPLYLSIINRPKSADIWYTKGVSFCFWATYHGSEKLASGKIRPRVVYVFSRSIRWIFMNFTLFINLLYEFIS